MPALLLEAKCHLRLDPWQAAPGSVAMLSTKGPCTDRLGYAPGQSLMLLDFGSKCLLRDRAELDQGRMGRWQCTAIPPQGSCEIYTEM